MNFLRLLTKEAREIKNELILTTVASGLAMGGTMAVVNTVAERTGDDIDFRMLLFFIACSAVYLFSSDFAVNRTSQIVEEMLCRTRQRIAEKVRRVDMLTFEQLGSTRIYNTLSRETFVISEAGASVIYSASAAVMLIFSSLYVATLSPFAFIIVLTLVACAVYFYKRGQQISGDLMRRASETETNFFDMLQHQLDGFKEVKICHRRSDDLYWNYIAVESEVTKELKLRSSLTFNRSANTTHIFFYILLAFVVFVLPQHVTDKSIIEKITYVVLFVTGSIEVILKALPVMARADLAIEKLDRLEREVDAALRSPEAMATEDAQSTFEHIDCRSMMFTYPGEEGKQFTVGPIDFTIRRGEMVFIVGGNGSGKSTFMKLLTRLYTPETGGVFWDGQLVTRTNAVAYRSMFSTIFADFHLFDRLYGQNAATMEQVGELLAEMELDQKTDFVDGRFTAIDLSTGQRKRLAMVAALLEDKPIYVFDEWAADQDPTFRRHFYDTLLPNLRRRGKTVIAVTHDERYFDRADRILLMQDGHLKPLEGAAICL